MATVQDFCDYIGIEPLKAALRAIEKYNIEHVWLVLRDPVEGHSTIYYHTLYDYPHLRIPQEAVISAVGVGGAGGMEGEEFEWERTSALPDGPTTEQTWEVVEELRDAFHRDLREHFERMESAQ